MVAVFCLLTANAIAQPIPDISNLDYATKSSIQLACIGAKSSGPASYSRCLNKQLADYSQTQPIPEISNLDYATKSSIQLACIGAKSSGPASYSRCLNKQLASIGISAGETPKTPHTIFQKQPEVVKPRIRPNITYENETEKLARERKKLQEERKKFKALRLAEEKRLEEERKKLETLRLAEEERQQQAQAEKKQPPTPQSGSGSGFFVSKMGHVITNAHVVQNCKNITIGDNANKQVPAEVINTDRSNDLALLKLSTLEMASAESKSLIQKLSIVVVPLAAKGLLRSEDVKLGEKVLVAGFPFGEYFSNTIKVTGGLVSATRGAGDDSGQFQLDAAVQPGNSGGPIYDSSGNIVGVVVSQLDKLKMAKAIGSLPENVNFGIKASTVRQFLTSSGLPSKKAEQAEEKSTEQLAKIAKNQALMVMCLQ
jgi:S1-C subfamily serine protease